MYTIDYGALHSDMDRQTGLGMHVLSDFMFLIITLYSERKAPGVLMRGGVWLSLVGVLRC